MKFETQAVLLILVIALAAAAPHAGQSISSPKQHAEDAAGYKDFNGRVQAYVKQRNSIESSLPPLKNTDLPEMIVAHQQALARKIREARPGAKPRDIFSPASLPAFRHAVRSAFRGTQGANLRATIRQGAPLKEVHLTVNQVYPDAVPYTTVPPSLLEKFPKLPDEVAYRVVGRDLVLLDVKANLVVDLLHEILP